MDGTTRAICVNGNVWVFIGTEATGEATLPDTSRDPGVFIGEKAEIDPPVLDVEKLYVVRPLRRDWHGVKIARHHNRDARKKILRIRSNP